MKPDLVEDTLARYAPSGPPPELKEQVIETALRHARGRQRVRWIFAFAGVVALTGAVLNFAGDRVYSNAERMAQGKEMREPGTAIAHATLFSTEMPGAQTLLAWNGDSDE